MTTAPDTIVIKVSDKPQAQNQIVSRVVDMFSKHATGSSGLGHQPPIKVELKSLSHGMDSCLKVAF